MRLVRTSLNFYDDRLSLLRRVGKGGLEKLFIERKNGTTGWNRHFCVLGCDLTLWLLDGRISSWNSLGVYFTSLSVDSDEFSKTLVLDRSWKGLKFELFIFRSLPAAQICTADL